MEYKGTCERFVLGTAQLGMKYGIANRVGKPNRSEAFAIVRTAWEQDITTFDTAQGYGESESILGETFCALGIAEQAQVISKLDPNIDHGSSNALRAAVEQSLKRLQVPCLSGMMIHREEYLNLWDRGLGEGLLACQRAGLVRSIGVSVYHPQRALEALNLDGIEIIQVPTNILDHRFIAAGVFSLAEKKRKRILVRSALLQGLLVMELKRLPPALSFALPVLERFESLAHDCKMTRAALAIQFVKWQVPNASMVLGAETVEQVEQNVACWKREVPPEIFDQFTRSLSDVDERFFNPSLWPVQ